ncbi:hypothetical protein LSAT2_018017 [Lamellibrachia satsuma]|nr:hypothetical protein LSAT2_018017 [Lamellibrachia satsuma]
MRRLHTYYFDDGEPPPADPDLQVSLYRVVHAVDLLTPSCEDNTIDPYLDRRLTVTFWLCYAFGDVRGFRPAAFERTDSRLPRLNATPSV